MIPAWLTIPPQAQREYDAIEAATGCTIDYRAVGAWIRYVRSMRYLQPLFDHVKELGIRHPRGSIARRWYRAEWFIVHAEQQRRACGDVPADMLPTARNERSLDDRVSEIRQRYSIERFLHDECALDVRHRKTTCPIPGHDDDSASFVVFSDGKAKCFGCHFYGDVIDLAGAVRGLPFIEALKHLEGTA